MASSLRRVNPLRAAEVSTLCRLEIRDTAGWKPALRRPGAEFRARWCKISGLGGTGTVAAGLTMPENRRAVVSVSISVPGTPVVLIKSVSLECAG
jgi:hypothetical protein